MSKTAKILVALFAAGCLIIVGATALAWWYVESGRLQTLIEAQIAAQTGIYVEMGALSFSWPWSVEIEQVTVAAAGHEDSPLLTCPKLRIRSAPWHFLRKRIDSVVAIGAKVHLVEDGQGVTNVPTLPEGGGGGGTSFVLETAKLVDGTIDLDLQTLQASVDGIIATLSTPLLPGGDDITLRLNVAKAETTVPMDGTEPIPVGVKLAAVRIGLRKDSSMKTEIEGRLDALVTTRVPYLLLPPGIPVGASFAFDYVPRSGSLENALIDFNIPLFSKISAYGSVANLTGDTPSLNMNVTVQTPEIAKLNEYNELLQRPTFKGMSVTGAVAVNGTIKGNLAKPELSLRANTENSHFEWQNATIESMAVDVPITLGAEGFKLGPGKVSASRARIPASKGVFFDVAPLATMVEADASGATFSELTARVNDTLDLSIKGDYTFDSGAFHSNVRLAESAVSDVFKTVSPLVGKLPDTFDGKMKLACAIEGKLGDGLERVKVDYDASLAQGEFSAGEFFMADRIGASASGTVQTESPDGVLKFSTKGTVGGFEILVDTFYKDLAEKQFPIACSGEYDLKSKRLRNASGTVTIGEIGTITARGDASLASSTEVTAVVASDGINLKKLFDEVVKEVMSETSSLVADAEIDGTVSTKFNVKVQGNQWNTDGTMKLAGGHVSLNEGATTIRSISADMPFVLHSPRPEPTTDVRFEEKDYGTIKLDGLVLGPANIDSLVLKTALKQNALSVKKPATLNILGGTVDINDIRGDNLLGSKVRVTTSMNVRGVDIGKTTESLGLPKVVGTLDGSFPAIDMTTDVLTTGGEATANVFGGTVNVTSIEVDKPLSSVRGFRADIECKEMDLSRITTVLNFGSISGVVEGTLKGLEIAQGQAAAFEADFETVERRGVRQRINFDAVENITILGTGRGLTGGMSRGFASFFEDFGYDKIGFICSLKNDNFKMKGKVVRGDTEYFVKGVLIGPQINVINRNPGQIISFKSMLERINRIGSQKAKDEP